MTDMVSFSLQLASQEARGRFDGPLQKPAAGPGKRVRAQPILGSR